MHTIIDYTVVNGSSTEELAKKVKTFIMEGWYPYGGASATYVTISAGSMGIPALEVFQAMVKYQ